MPITLALLALAAKALFPELSWAEAFLLGRRALADRPGGHLGRRHLARVPSSVRHTLNLESGLNDGLALPFVLFFLVLASPGGDAGTEAVELAGEAVVGAAIGVALGMSAGACTTACPAAASPPRTRASTRSASASSPSASPTSRSATG